MMNMSYRKKYLAMNTLVASYWDYKGEAQPIIYKSFKPLEINTKLNLDFKNVSDLTEFWRWSVGTKNQNSVRL